MEFFLFFSSESQPSVVLSKSIGKFDTLSEATEAAWKNAEQPEHTFWHVASMRSFLIVAQGKRSFGIPPGEAE